MNKPLVTIITATYNLIENNRKSFFIQMVNSVRNQTYSNIEHLIIDGGSTDGSIELFKELGLNYISEPDNGIYDAFNKGVKHAKGQYINFMNSDDFFCNNKAVELSVNALIKTNADFLCASANILDENGNLDVVFKPRMKSVFCKMPFCHQTMFTKTDTLRSLGGFDLKYKSASDYDFIIKLVLNNAKYVTLKDITASFRAVGESVVNFEKSCNEQVAIFQENYSKYIKTSFEECQRAFIVSCPPLRLLLSAHIKDISMYLYIFNYYLKELRKSIFYFRMSKDKKKRFLAVFRKYIIKPEGYDVLNPPEDIKEFVRRVKNN